MTTTFERIAAKARGDKTMRFTSLCHHITPALLWESLNEIPYDTSAGVDRINLKQAKKTFPQWSQEVISQIHRGGYRPAAARRVYIPKPGKVEKRPLNVPTVIDRAIQRSVNKVLNNIYEADFLACSFGGRPERNAHQALATIKHAIDQKGVNWVYEADLKNFFGSLNHGWVEQFIDLRVGDPRLIRLIKRWLRAGHLEGGKRIPAQQGAAQGGPISVLLSNLYLHYVLDLWIEKVVKPRLKGRVYYVRYLDDFILGFQYETDAKRFESALIKRLERFSLALEPSKTRFIAVGRHARNKARREGKPMQTFYFLGFTLYNTRSRTGLYVIGMKTEKSRLKRGIEKLKATMKAIRHKPLETQIKSINSFLTGSYCYYGVMGNMDSLQRLYYTTLKQWKKTLSTRSQSGRLNWEKFRKILSVYPIRRPRIYIGYKQLEQLVLL
ncbi:MAG: reverse transcriptase domain-containing protein [Gammaproteobacteria bacterium]|jgi:RNA-directed DNA polymerase